MISGLQTPVSLPMPPGPDCDRADNLEYEDPGVANPARSIAVARRVAAFAPGFEAIPVEKIGLQRSPLRPEIPSRPLHPGAITIRSDFRFAPHAVMC